MPTFPGTASDVINTDKTDEDTSRCTNESRFKEVGMICDESYTEGANDQEQDNELGWPSQDDKALNLKLRDLDRRFQDYSRAPCNLAKLEFNQQTGISREGESTCPPSGPSCPSPAPLKSIDILGLLVLASTPTKQLSYKVLGLEALFSELESLKAPLGESEIQRANLAANVRVELDRTLASVLAEKHFQELQDVSFIGVRRVHIATALPSEQVIPPIANSVMILVAIIHCTMGVSRDNCALILRSIQAIMKMAFRLQNPGVVDLYVPLISDIPITLPTVLHHLGLEEQLDTYVACPTCHTLYRENDSSVAIPDSCSTVNLEGTICGAQLYAGRHRGNHSWQQPYRRFSHQTLESWLTRFLNRPGIEKLIESTSPALQTRCTDVWGASYMSTFPGENEPSFFVAPPGELRLAFLLYHDFYNPFGNRQGGKKQSVGMIMMACLNLPPDIRYNIENIYVTRMIPGPKELAQERINNYLRPIAINLEEHFTTGVVITRTHNYPRGRKVRSAAPLNSMDIVASRAAAGIGGHSHTLFCSFCDATLPEIDVLVGAAFKPRSMEEHRVHAQAWLSATNLEEREALWKKNGARYSELLRLPWWDAFKGTLVAPMHWTKNIIEKQVRDNMGSSVVTPSGIPSLRSLSRDITANELNWGQLALDHLSTSELLKAGLTEPLARYLCRKRDIFEAGLHSKALLKKLNSAKST